MARFDPEGRQDALEALKVAWEGCDPAKVSYQALMKAHGLWGAGEIRASQIRETAERLTAEELEEDLARQEFMDEMEKDLPDTSNSPPKNSK